jgi:hypothetical protein
MLFVVRERHIVLCYCFYCTVVDRKNIQLDIEYFMSKNIDIKFSALYTFLE